MRTVVFFLLFVFRLSGQTLGQSEKPIHYVFDSFITGTVLMKSGESYQQVLNYNIVTREMVFENAGIYMAVANPENVDTVTISGRKFIPVGEAFYEWLGGLTYPGFLEYTYILKDPSVDNGFGKATTANVSNSKSLTKDGQVYRLQSPGLEIIRGYNFYIRKNERFYKFSNEQQLIKVIPSERQRISELVKSNKINFKNASEVQQLIMQIN